MHTVITQPAQDNPGMFPEGPLKFLTSETYRGPLQETLREPIQKFKIY